MNITVDMIRDRLQFMDGFGKVMIPEFTFSDRRIDALVLDIKTRKAHGFEIKLRRQDFLADKKWQWYSEFCTDLCIACPAELVKAIEVPDPFGLVWFKESERKTEGYKLDMEWIKKPQQIQQTEGMAWLWTWVRIIERELPRQVFENSTLKMKLKLKGGSDAKV